MRRRCFLSALGASAALPQVSWAAAGNPEYLAAARHGTDRYMLHGLRADGSSAFIIDLPGRGHAAAAHPHRAEAVAIARRPGTFAFVIDCVSGAVISRLTAPEGRHFYGHGAFTADGATLLLTENDIASGAGRLSLWDVAAGYRRVAELPSGGIGPHEILRRPDGGFAIANGGIRTHPDTGREKLNLDTMAPNLTLLDADFRLERRVELPHALHQNSIRHLAARPDGQIALGLQWNGGNEAVPSVAVVLPDGELQLCEVPDALARRIEGYVGSIAYSGDGTLIAATAPRGNCLMLFDPATGDLAQVEPGIDICGVAATATGLIATQGDGTIRWLPGASRDTLQADLAWDNHLVAIR
ncbi:DUF1513 domain-containing protein [Pontivivens ytuae]|nr:DUF1513 domain-containing protein [Pontivivens ytuae]